MKYRTSGPTNCGFVKYPSFTTSVGVVAAHDGPRVTPTRMSAPVGET